MLLTSNLLEPFSDVSHQPSNGCSSTLRLQATKKRSPGISLMAVYTSIVSTLRKSMNFDTASRRLARVGLGAFLAFAGVSHFRSTSSFLAQVPPFLPQPELIVYISGVVEICLGLALIFLQQRRTTVGWIVALFFAAVFPGNISQYLTHTSAFGLDTDVARAIRLAFQPILVAWALWSAGALKGRIQPR